MRDPDPEINLENRIRIQHHQILVEKLDFILVLIIK